MDSETFDMMLAHVEKADKRTADMAAQLDRMREIFETLEEAYKKLAEESKTWIKK